METNAPIFHKAEYKSQRIPQFQGNPFIEALPVLGGEADVLKGLLSLPKFDLEQRGWADHERFQMIMQLSNFMLPFERHLQLVYSVDSMMRQGYVDRLPHSVRSSSIFKKLHEKTLLTVQDGVTPQISSALVGMSGTGKTTTLKRFLASIPQVIEHPSYGLYQIPYLHIEMPYDGASVIGLAQSIFRKIDNILPGANYAEQYLNGRSGADTLMNHAARLLHMHHVGLLIVDEVQNLSNAPKNKKALMTLLVTASNELGVPILFVGTTKARDLLSLSFRQARRSCGYGIPLWDRMENGPLDGGSDWGIFARTLLNYQWVRNPAKPSPFLADLLYDLSQGIIDVAIKLFACAQVRAIMDQSETLSAELLVDVSKRELGMLAPMIAALRQNDIAALQAFDDIEPLALEGMVSDVSSRYAGRRVAGAGVTPASESYNQLLSGALETLGFESEAAQKLTRSSVESGAKNAIDGLQKALKHATSGRSRVRNNASDTETAATYEPGDYRNALQASGGSSLDRFEELKMLPDLDTQFVA